MKIADDVINVLKAVEVYDNAVRITAQLDRKLYQNTAKVLKAMGGKWLSAKKATVLSDKLFFMAYKPPSESSCRCSVSIIRLSFLNLHIAIF